MREWDVPAWGNLRPDDRPQLAVTADFVIATDPVYQRILIYDLAGELLRVMRDSSTPPVPSGVDATADSVIVSDRVQSQLVGYPLDGTGEDRYR